MGLSYRPASLCSLTGRYDILIYAIVNFIPAENSPPPSINYRVCLYITPFHRISKGQTHEIITQFHTTITFISLFKGWVGGKALSVKTAVAQLRQAAV
jgi:hypothetical protein